MSVYVNNITINIGTDFEQVFDLYDNTDRVVDLTGYSAKSSLRKHRGSSNSVSFIVGFPNREQGKIKISIPSWTTSKLKSGRHVYDVLLTSPEGNKSIVIEGSINARSGISTNCSFSLPTSAQRLCIAVIDEASGLTSSETKWGQFRSTYPNRTFYLLQPTGVGFGVSVNNTNYNELKCPDNFLNETTVNVSPLI